MFGPSILVRLLHRSGCRPKDKEYDIPGTPEGLHGWLKAAKNILFPPLCLYCEVKTDNSILCPECRQRITFLCPHLCGYCSKPINLNNSGLCLKCSGKSLPYDRVISAAGYKEPMISLIHLFKYKNYAWLGEFLTSLLTEYLEKISFNPVGYDLTLAVPLHRHKLKTRGYNQAYIIAECLSKYFKIPCENGIINNINIGPPQAKLSQNKRLKNVAGSFIVEKGLGNKNIILVDDIFTTGSTVTSCCQALKQARAGKITVITLAKTIMQPLQPRNKRETWKR